MRKALLVMCLLPALSAVCQAQLQNSGHDIPTVVASARGTVVLLKTFDRRGKVLGLGSGFRIAGGRLVTNAHVVAGAARVEIFDDAGTLLGIARSADMLSTTVDLAILPSVGSRAPFLPLANASPVIGEHVIVIGAPEGLTNTVSDGIVSAQRKIGSRQVLQISAPISPGSSGGPVLNTRGEVVGVSEAILREGQNLNFAVPASDVIALVASRPGQFEFPALAEEGPQGPGRPDPPARSAGSSAPPTLDVGSAVSGQLTPNDNIPGGGYVDYFRLDGANGRSVSIIARSVDFAPFVGVFRYVGDSIVTVGAEKGSDGWKIAKLDVTLTAGVIYVIVISAANDSHSKMGGYDLIVAPDFRAPSSASVRGQERWLDASATDLFVSHFDRTRITSSGYGTYQVWLRSTYRAPYKNRNGEVYDVTLAQYELSCRDTRYRVLSVARYLKDGLVSSSSEPTPWYSAIPESVAEAAEQTICAYAKSYGL